MWLLATVACISLAFTFGFVIGFICGMVSAEK